MCSAPASGAPSPLTSRELLRMPTRGHLYAIELTGHDHEDGENGHPPGEGGLSSPRGLASLGQATKGGFPRPRPPGLANGFKNH